MKKTSTVLIFFLFLIFFKTRAIPVSLENDIETETFDKLPDTTKVLNYAELGNKYRERDPKRSRTYLYKGLDLAQKIHFYPGEVKIYLFMGIHEGAHYNYPKALENLMKAYKTATENRLISIDLASAMTQISFIYDFYKRSDLALKYANEADVILKRFRLNKDNSYIYNSLATVHQNSGNLDKAIELLKRIEREYDSPDDNNLQYVSALNNLSSCYAAKGQPAKSLEYLFLALKTLNDSLKISSGMYLKTLNNIGNAYRKMGKYDSAFFYLSRSLNANSLLEKSKWNAINSRDIGYVFLASGNFKKAKFYAEQYIDISKQNDFTEDIRRGYKLLYDIYLKEKNATKALEYLTKYSELNDSVNSQEQAAIVMNVYLKNIIDEKELQNQSLKSDNRKKELVIKDKQVFQIILIIISTFIFIFTIVVIYLFIQYRITNDLLKQQAEEILQKNAQLGSQNQLLTELNEEIKGITGIVSHDLKAPINRIESLLGFIGKGDNLTKDQQGYLNIAAKEVNNSKELIKQILETGEQTENQKITMDLFDINRFLNELSMKYALQAGNKNIAFHAQIPGSIFEVRTNKNHMERILDNLLSNAIKFSESGKNIYLNIVNYSDHVLLTVHDEGPGFSEADMKDIYKKYHTLSAKSTAGESSSGLGLYIVKQLTFEIGISIEVESKPGAGTTFNLKIPLTA